MNTEMNIGGHDCMLRQEIVDDCRTIKYRASSIGVAAEKMHGMPAEFIPGCMDELNEAEGVLQRAIRRIEKAKQVLMSKPKYAEAAE